MAKGLPCGNTAGLKVSDTDDGDGAVDVLVPDGKGDKEVAFPHTAEAGVMQVALSGMAGSFANAATRSNNAANQLASDSQRMWSIAMTSPTVMAAHGMRVASEAGSGRTRVEANTPAGGQTIGG